MRINSDSIDNYTNVFGPLFGCSGPVVKELPYSTEVLGVVRKLILDLLKNGSMKLGELVVEIRKDSTLIHTGDRELRRHVEVQQWNLIEEGKVEITIDYKLCLADPKRFSKNKKKVPNA